MATKCEISNIGCVAQNLCNVPSENNSALESAFKMKFREQKCPFSSSRTMPFFNPGQDTVPASQIICRLGVPSHSTYKHSAHTVKRQPQNEQTTLGSQCADNARWLAPGHIDRKQQCLASGQHSPRKPHRETSFNHSRHIL